ncbi:MAG: type-4 uracil-DNA glycosylase [Candidatus Asgardarchaeia archaeon]
MKLNEEVKNCKKCPLWKSRKNAVPGEGNLEPIVMLIGEAPGRQEDIQGRPFVGAAGKLLDENLKKIGISREEVYITNVVKCRPPGNRDPTELEIQICSKYLDRQIDLIKPKIIVTLGNHSTKYILEKFGFKHRGISREHGKVYKVDTLYQRFYIMPIYHPAAALYNRGLEGVLEGDFLKLKALIEEVSGVKNNDRRILHLG